MPFFLFHPHENRYLNTCHISHQHKNRSDQSPRRECWSAYNAAGSPTTLIPNFHKRVQPVCSSPCSLLTACRDIEFGGGELAGILRTWMTALFQSFCLVSIFEQCGFGSDHASRDVEITAAYNARFSVLRRH